MKNGEYILVKAPDQYNGVRYRGKYIYEHHLVWWKETGLYIPDGKCIHHKNGNKTDNRIENLECISISDHSRGHSKPTVMLELICAYCGAAFFRERRNVIFKRKTGQSNFYCCRKHQYLSMIKNRNIV